MNLNIVNWVGNVVLDVIHLYCPIMACINAKCAILFSIYCYIEVIEFLMIRWYFEVQFLKLNNSILQCIMAYFIV
jgi:hypothetical protein